MIIALNGVKGSGKDTIGGLLQVHYGFKPYSFAKPLKEMVKLAFPFTDEQLYGPSEKREEMLMDYPFSGPCLKCGGVTAAMHVKGKDAEIHLCLACHAEYPTHINARIALQTLGTEWGRRLYKPLWAKAAMNYCTNVGGNFVLTDTRFLTEFQAVSQANGYVVRLKRFWDDDRGATHASEVEMKSIPDSRCDYLFPDVPLEQLGAELQKMLAALGGVKSTSDAL